uniref:Anaphase-promoting complex subunit 1 n=1 Tax=Strongyloides venezuelensis TaxID=75913 RepID=A0A0K0EWL6_STRVS
MYSESFEIKDLINDCDLLSYITKLLYNSLPKVTLNNYKSLNAKLYLKESFNNRSCLKNLTNTRISLGKYYTSLDDSYSENIKHLYHFIMECLISILSLSKSKFLHFMEAEHITLEFFEKIGILFPSLTTILFSLYFYIPENPLYKIPSLRNVVFNDERKFNIPPWIETVMFLYFDSDFYYPDDVVTDNKNNEHHLTLINNSFNILLRYLKENDIYYIVFLKNFEKWKELDNLMCICHKLKFVT